MIPVIVLATAALPIWWGAYAWRLANAPLRWAGVASAALLTTGICILSILSIAGVIAMHSGSAPVPALRVAGSTAKIQRGEALIASFCGNCHSSTSPLTGGRDLGAELPLPIGSFVASNLTPAGQLSHWSDGEIFRAIRNGIDADGNWLTIMSYTNAGNLSDEDTLSLIAYLRSLPASGRATVNPPDRLSPVGVILLGAGLLPKVKPAITRVIIAPPKAPTARYGEYIVSYQDCRQCHGANLSGGVSGQLGPVGPDLNLVKAWKPAQFIATMRTGTDPWGRQLSKQMPWRPIGKMDDVELTALYEYLTQLPDRRTTAIR